MSKETQGERLARIETKIDNGITQQLANLTTKIDSIYENMVTKEECMQIRHDKSNQNNSIDARRKRRTDLILKAAPWVVVIMMIIERFIP